jgi:hypothetical protein
MKCNFYKNSPCPDFLVVYTECDVAQITQYGN